MVGRKQPREKRAGIDSARDDARQKRVEVGLDPEASPPPVEKLKARKKGKAK